MIYGVMGLKIYKIRCIGGEVTFPVEVKGDRMYVTFKRRFGDRMGSLSCNDVAIQQGIEGSDRFLNGEIEVVSVEEEVPVSDDSILSDRADESDRSDGADESDRSDRSDKSDESVETAGKYDEVTRFSDARQILNKEFGIPYSRLSNSEMVRNEAKGVGVVFRNLGTK